MKVVRSQAGYSTWGGLVSFPLLLTDISSRECHLWGRFTRVAVSKGLSPSISTDISEVEMPVGMG